MYIGPGCGGRKLDYYKQEFLVIVRRIDFSCIGIQYAPFVFRSDPDIVGFVDLHLRNRIIYFLKPIRDALITV